MRILKNILITFLILVVTFPLAFMTTVLTFPFWRWFETQTGIESFGHSGPADWCYWLIYVIFIIFALMVWAGVKRASDSGD